jgi:hypothetical protein
MESLAAGVLATLVGARSLVAAWVLGLLAGLVLDITLRLGSERPRLPRALAFAALGTVALAVGGVYALLAWPWLRLGSIGVLGMSLGLLVFAVPVGTLLAAGRPAPMGGFTGWFLRASLLVILAAAAGVTLVASGFLSLAEDRLVLQVDVTGETGTRLVHWTPPDGEPQEETLMTHHVVFREPEGAVVAEAWVYGDEVAVKGRVLRLSPALNVAGLPNLFELLFAHNGYTTAERHNRFPHIAVALPHMGPLSVHPLWRPFQRRLLAYWEGRSDGGSWAVRSATLESTYFPLVDPDGKPITRTYRLVLTPGGLTAS